MKWMRKINRGVLLTGVILAGVVVYLMLLGGAQRAHIPDIKTVTEAYVLAETQWRTLPESARTESPSLSEAELEQYMEEQAGLIRQLYIDNDAIVEPLIQRMRGSLQSQAAGSDVILEYKKDILKFEDITFDSGRVQVRLSCQTTIQVVRQGQSRMVEETWDTLILEKSGETWKVVYANLIFPLDYRPDGEDFPIFR